jgi:rhodanese-related sulfurtransferase
MITRLPSRWTLLGLTVGVLLLAAGAVSLTPRIAPSLAPWTLDPADPKVSLEDVEREVIRRYPVADVTSATLASMIGRGDVTLFDVRTPEEFDSGHLLGAIRVEPGSGADQILNLHRDKLRDRPVVFYCAVGVRASDVMMRSLKQLAPHANAGVYNLRGGLFRWTAEGRALVRANNPDAGPGKAHHFDDRWKLLLARTIAG